MIRTQISLTEAQMAALRREARKRGVSISALIRKAVKSELGEDQRQERIRRAMEVVGAYASGHSDISAEHDAHLDPGYEP